ncbi:unnamed protein product [Gongylonema pulchrum]|nr:unnamed protein product [Gongylonema pulchrum]
MATVSASGWWDDDWSDHPYHHGHHGIFDHHHGPHGLFGHHFGHHGLFDHHHGHHGFGHGHGHPWGNGVWGWD